MAALGGVPDLKLLIWRIEKESKIERKAEESKVRERGGEEVNENTERAQVREENIN